MKTFGNLGRTAGFFQYLMKRKFRRKWGGVGAGGMLFQNAQKINLKVPVSPISDLWKRFEISLVYEFTGKKASSSPAHLFAITGRQKRGFFDWEKDLNCLLQEK